MPHLGEFKVVNRVHRVTPTFTVFDVDPSNPERITDGDFTTETGEGTKALGAPADIGTIDFDMGRAYPVLVVAHMNVHRDSGDGTISVAIERSTDGIAYIYSGVYNLATRIVDTYYAILPSFTYSRYFRVRLYAAATSVASVYHAKIGQIQALQLL